MLRNVDKLLKMYTWRRKVLCSVQIFNNYMLCNNEYFSAFPLKGKIADFQVYNSITRNYNLHILWTFQYCKFVWMPCSERVSQKVSALTESPQTGTFRFIMMSELCVDNSVLKLSRIFLIWMRNSLVRQTLFDNKHSCMDRLIPYATTLKHWKW